jgi:hypothetical protein
MNDAILLFICILGMSYSFMMPEPIGYIVLVAILPIALWRIRRHDF